MTAQKAFANGKIVYGAELDNVARGTAENGTYSGLAPTQSGSPAMSVDVASGSYKINKQRYAYAGGTITITAADGTKNRWDLIIADSSGISVIDGVADLTDPQVPALPAASTAIATVYVGAGVTSITDTEIFDERIILASSFSELTTLGDITNFHGNVRNNPLSISGAGYFLGGVLQITDIYGEIIVTVEVDGGSSVTLPITNNPPHMLPPIRYNTSLVISATGANATVDAWYKSD